MNTKAVFPLTHIISFISYGKIMLDFSVFIHTPMFKNATTAYIENWL